SSVRRLRALADASWRISDPAHTLMPTPGKAPEGCDGRRGPGSAAAQARGDPGCGRGGLLAADGRGRAGAPAAEKRPMTDMSAWLRSLGLGQYEAAFRDNAVDDA